MAKGLVGSAKETAALLVALRNGDLATASDLFRQSLRGGLRDPGLRAWVDAGQKAFFMPADRAAWDRDIAAARSDRMMGDLLFARILWGSGRASAALVATRLAMARGPDRAEPRLLLCAMLLKQADPEAQAVLHQCLEGSVGRSPGWDQVGVVLLSLGKRDAALVCFRRSEPNLGNVMRRGQLARELGRLEEARLAFGQAVTLDRRSPRAWFLLGVCAQDQRDFDAAATAYETALALDPTLAEAAVNLGTARQEGGDLAGAKAAYRHALRTRPDTFGRVAQALSTSPRGEVWLDLRQLRRTLAE